MTGEEECYRAPEFATEFGRYSRVVERRKSVHRTRN